MMDRRTLLKQLGLFTGGIMLMPACNLDPKMVSVALDNLDITVEQEDLMKLLVEVIIPEGTFPGAKTLEVDKFVWVMADDCLTPKVQMRFIAGLGQFNALFKSKTAKDFANEKAKDERLPFVKEIMQAKAPEPPPLPLVEVENAADEKKVEIPLEQYLAYIQEFVNTVKNFSITGYLQSEYIMTEVMPYALVPGKEAFCKTIDPSQKVNIHG